MSSWTEGDVAVDGVSLHYTRTGGAGPPLVLAHGVTDDGLCWSPVAADLARDYDVIMVDARGHGRSDAPAQGYDPATLAADLAGVIAGLGLRRPAILGHSMGAATTLALAGRFPELPGAILLEDPPGWWLPAAEPVSAEDASRVIYGRREDVERLAGMQAWFAGLKRKTRDELIAEQRAATPGWPEAELAPWADSKLQVSDNVLRVFDPETPRAVDWPATLARISCPALLLTADPGLGAVLSAEGADALRAVVPQLEVVHIPGAGHNIRRDRPEAFLEAVRAFLASHYGPGSGD